MPRHVHHFTPEERSRGRAKRLGVDYALFQRLLKLGLKHCWGCKRWRARHHFGKDTSRSDGLCPRCRDCRHTSRKEAA